MTSYSFLSWNVNGSKNVSEVPYARKLVLSSDVIFLQETFETVTSSKFKPNQFLHFGSDAIATGGRPSGGLSTLVRISKISGVITRLHSPVPWILALRWTEPGRIPIILINVYVARFSRTMGQFSFDIFRNFFMDVRASYSGDAFLVSGDWNADPFRDNSGRDERDIKAFMSDLASEGFSRFPAGQVPTFCDRGVSSSLDFSFTTNQIKVANPRVGPQRCCQHFPLIMTLQLQPIISTMPEGTLDSFSSVSFIFPLSFFTYILTVKSPAFG